MAAKNAFRAVITMSSYNSMQKVANLQGLVVIDVVEGTAMSSLPHMMNVLRQRPQSFASLQEAVHWARRSGDMLGWNLELPLCLRLLM